MIYAFLAKHALKIGAVLAIAFAVGYYGHVRYEAGKAVVQAELDAQRAAWQTQYDAKAAETARVEEQRDQLKWSIENDLKPKLEAATSVADDLAVSLRNYRARRCPVPATAGSASEPGGAGGEPADGDGVEEALGAHLGACARDAERLTAWQRFYEGLRVAQ